MLSPETRHFSTRQRMFAAVGAVAAAATAGGVLAYNKLHDTYQGPDTMVLSGQTVPLRELAQKLDSESSVAKVYEKPFSGVGGSRQTAEAAGPNEFQARLLEDQDIQEVEARRKSFGAEFKTAIQLKNGMRINVYKSGTGDIDVNPEGVGDMIQSLVSSIPYVQESPYKQRAMRMYQKAEQRQLTNIQTDIIVAADQNTQIDNVRSAFTAGPGSGGESAFGTCSSPTVAMEGVNRTHYNGTIAFGRSPGMDISNVQVHEVAHLWTAAGSTDAENAVEDVDLWAAAAGDGNNDEHNTFVLPVASIGSMVYEQSVQAGMAEPAFTYSRK